MSTPRRHAGRHAPAPHPPAPAREGCASDADIPGVEVLALPAGAPDLRVVIEPAPPPIPSTAVDRAWEDLRRENPRCYDGPLLAVTGIDFSAARAVVRCRLDSFRRLAVQGRGVDTGVWLLAVTAVLKARDARGVPHVLLGRRGRATRVYPGMWELGPSGGVDPPASLGPDDGAPLTPADLRAALEREVREESGLHLDLASARCLGVVRDAASWSFDACYAAEVPIPVESLRAAAQAGDEHAWEYEETRWVPIAGVPAFERENAAGIIPPARAIFRLLGWTAPP